MRKACKSTKAFLRARESVAVLLNAQNPNEIAFGMNATSFIRLVRVRIWTNARQTATSLSSPRWITRPTFPPGLRLRRMAHASNGGQCADDGNLHVEDLKPLLSSRMPSWACTVASNALGSIVDVAAAARLAHEVGAERLTASITALMELSMCKPWIATTWFVPGIRSSLLIRDSSGQARASACTYPVSRGLYSGRAARENRGRYVHLRKRGGIRRSGLLSRIH